MDIWVKALLNGIDEILDEKQKKSILEKCGATCPFTHLPDEKLLELKKQSCHEREFLDLLCEHWRMEKKGAAYHVVFDQCYCPLVNKNLQGASKTLCYCTMGNIKHKFKIGTGRDVDVVMEKTILAGDEECRFSIKL